jgi:mono/diheme cytochrome c family protein
MRKHKIPLLILAASAPLAAYLAAAPASRATEYHAAGKALYTAHCAACHGAAGKGDGRAACDFKVRPADLTDPDLADDTDEALVHKLVHAPKPMPSYVRLLDEQQRLEVIQYVRTLAGQPRGGARP